MATRAALNHPPHQEALLDPALEGPGRWKAFRRRLRLPRRIKLTREGKYFIGITFGLGLAAINTGNNLLYLLFGMLLSLIVVSSVLSEQSLRRLTVARRLPTRAQVGRAHLVEVEVYNHKGRIPSYAIEIEDLRRGQPADKRCFFLKISPESAQVAAYRRTPARRGLDRHVGFRVATRFPFGLFEKSRELAAEGDLIIYPAVDPLRLPPQHGGRREGTEGHVGRGYGEDVVGIRGLRDGDDPRDIYWRKSILETVVRERARETRHEVTLTVDDLHPGDAPDEEWSRQLERRIREVASRAVAHLRRGDRVTVRTTSGERVVADMRVGADVVLRFLALLEARPATAFARLGPRDRALSSAPPPPVPPPSHPSAPEGPVSVRGVEVGG